MAARRALPTAHMLAALIVGAALFALLGAAGLFATHPATRSRTGAAPLPGATLHLVPPATPAAAAMVSAAPPEPLILAVVTSSAQAQIVQDALGAADPLLATAGAASPRLVFIVLPEPSVLPALVAGRAAVQLLDLRHGPP